MISKRTKNVYYIYTIIWREPETLLHPPFLGEIPFGLFDAAGEQSSSLASSDKRCATEQYSCGAKQTALRPIFRFNNHSKSLRVFVCSKNKSWCCTSPLFLNILEEKKSWGFCEFHGFFNLGRENPPHSKRESPHVLATFGSERMIFILGRAWWVGFGQARRELLSCWIFLLGGILGANKGGKNRTKNGRNLRDSVREMGGFFWLAGIYTYVYIL